MTRDAPRIGLYIGSTLVFGAAVGLFLEVRRGEARDAVAARDRAALHAENDWSKRDRDALHAEARALEVAVARVAAQSTRRQDETQALLRDVVDRLKRLEARP